MVGPFLSGQTYYLGDSLCRNLADANGKVFFTTIYDNVACGDSNSFPMDPNRWWPNNMSFSDSGLLIRSVSRACQGTETVIVYYGNPLAVGTYQISTFGPHYMDATVGAKSYGTRSYAFNINPSALGGSFTITSYSERFGLPAIAIGSYQFTGGYYDFATNQWETKQFRGNFRFQMQ
jgi:hypothetical protein